MVNPLFVGYRKIGETGRTVERRRPELRGGYGTELEWEKESKHWTTNRLAAEAMAHRLLRSRRVRGSEMFRCSAARARKTVLQAVRIVEFRQRRWYWRIWHRLVMPRPEARPRPLAKGRGQHVRRHNPWPLVLLCLGLIIYAAHAILPEMVEAAGDALYRVAIVRRILSRHLPD